MNCIPAIYPVVFHHASGPLSFHFIDHTADAAVEITARSVPELFREAAASLRALMLGREGLIRGTDYRSIELEAEDCEALLVDFLNEVIFLFDSTGFLCADAELTLDGADTPDSQHVVRLRGRLVGELLDPSRHHVLTEVKAATFHDLRIVKESHGVRCCVVYDL